MNLMKVLINQRFLTIFHKILIFFASDSLIYAKLDCFLLRKIMKLKFGKSKRKKCQYSAVFTICMLKEQNEN